MPNYFYFLKNLTIYTYQARINVILKFQIKIEINGFNLHDSTKWKNELSHLFFAC